VSAVRRWHLRAATPAERVMMRAANAIQRARLHTARAVRRGRAGNLTGDAIALLWVVQDARCFYCDAALVGSGPDESWEVDHVIPFALGGTNEPHNVVLACRTCNQSKGGRAPLEWAAAHARSVRRAA